MKSLFIILCLDCLSAVAESRTVTLTVGHLTNGSFKGEDILDVPAYHSAKAV